MLALSAPKGYILPKPKDSQKKRKVSRARYEEGNKVKSSGHGRNQAHADLQSSANSSVSSNSSEAQGFLHRFAQPFQKKTCKNAEDATLLDLPRAASNKFKGSDAKKWVAFPRIAFDFWLNEIVKRNQGNSPNG